MRNRGRPDHWTRKAKAAGYSARSVYKLEEIERRERMLPRKGRVLDLGCSPGSWSQYLRRLAGPDLHLTGLDISFIEGYPGTFLQGNALTVSPHRLLRALGGPAHLVMSDMAPFTRGHRFTDHIRQLELAQAALHLARQVLLPGGDFVAKVFDGQDAHAYVQEVRQHFGRTRRIKPEVTRDESVEFFVVARGLLPAARLALPEDVPEEEEEDGEPAEE